MVNVAVTTTVEARPPETFDFLVDFQRYAPHSEYVERVERSGDGGEGTRYDLHAQWWRLRHTVTTEVTEVAPPRRLSWRTTGDVAARGDWLVDPVSGGDASSVTLSVVLDRDSVDGGVLDLPRFVSLSSLLDRAEPLVRREGERVLERVVADVEGDPRPVDLTVTVGDG